MSNFINSYRLASAESGWSTTDQTSGWTLTNNNLTATTTGGARIRGTTARSAGKAYLEYLVVSSDAIVFCKIGVRQTNETIGNSWTSDTNRIYYQCDDSLIIGGGSYSLGFTIPGGDTLCMAIDFDAGKIWCRKNNGAWNGDPAAGTGGISFTTGFTYAPGMEGTALSHSVTAAFTTGFTYSIPSGFSAWG